MISHRQADFFNKFKEKDNANPIGKIYCRAQVVGAEKGTRLKPMMVTVSLIPIPMDAISQRDPQESSWAVGMVMPFFRIKSKIYSTELLP